MEAESISKYQKALGGYGVVAYQGDPRWIDKDSPWGKSTGILWEKKRRTRKLPPGIRNKYAVWKKSIAMAEESILRSMDA